MVRAKWDLVVVRHVKFLLQFKKRWDQARKNLVYVPLAGNTIHHEISWNYGASKVFMKPASQVLELLPVARCAVVLEFLVFRTFLQKALALLIQAISYVQPLVQLTHIGTPDYVAAKRGKSVAEVMRDNKDKTIKVTLVKSLIGRKPKLYPDCKAIGLKKMNNTCIHPDNPAIRGLVNAIIIWCQSRSVHNELNTLSPDLVLDLKEDV